MADWSFTLKIAATYIGTQQWYIVPALLYGYSILYHTKVTFLLTWHTALLLGLLRLTIELLVSALPKLEEIARMLRVLASFLSFALGFADHATKQVTLFFKAALYSILSIPTAYFFLGDVNLIRKHLVYVPVSLIILSVYFFVSYVIYVVQSQKFGHLYSYYFRIWTLVTAEKSEKFLIAFTELILCNFGVSRQTVNQIFKFCKTVIYSVALMLMLDCLLRNFDSLIEDHIFYVTIYISVISVTFVSYLIVCDNDFLK